MCVTIEQHADGLMALPQHVARAQRPIQPAAQQACAHWRHAGIEHAKQRVLGATTLVRVDFQVASRCRVQRDRPRGAFHRHAGEVWQRAFLRFLDVAQQATSGSDAQRHTGDAEAAEIARTEKAIEFAGRRGGIKMPRWPLAQAGQGADQFRPRHIFADQRLGGLQPREFRRQCFGVCCFADQKASAGQIDPGQPAGTVGTSGDGQQQVVAAGVQQRRIGHRAGRDDAHHLALDDALGQRRVAHLLADGHRFAQVHQPRQVVFHRVVGHASHWNRRTGRLPTLGQGDVEQPRCLARVVVEQLVEIAHAEEQQHIRVLRLGGKILAYERRVRGTFFGVYRWSSHCPGFSIFTYSRAASEQQRAALSDRAGGRADVFNGMVRTCRGYVTCR